MMISVDPVRWGGAAVAVAAYAGMCLALLRARRGLRREVDAGNADWLVAYASQTGTGEALAAHTVATLRTGGLSARAISVEHLDDATLRGTARILFIASTYGEGDAPDSAARLARLLDQADLALDQLHYAVLALGDSSYANYCGFGRRLDDALRTRGAQALFERVEVDRGRAAAIDAWQHHLSHLAGTSDAPDWSAPAYGHWRIAARHLLNPGSAGAPVYRIDLRPAAGDLPDWEAGDLVQVSAPGEPDYPREYSIASTMAEGCLSLLVRLHVRDDGSLGLASGWLCREAQEGDAVLLRVRQHKRFRIGENAGRALILIGNGTGIAGLRAHLKSRADAGEARNWLIFGERNEAHDHFCAADIAQWRQAGMLDTLSLTFSRDGDSARYVQHALEAQAAQLRAWVDAGAAIYVCGSLQGMAGAVHATLDTVLGGDTLAMLNESGRYRRDVY
ncbi:sulfite reductase subunit alpha [Massilia pseudoviolaceinigra]|uniref:sulfite reductase subunit alpha n=1 Tax=Massilia pseudoviolaceinigra TaxID=3057165 RepID=UPI002796C7B2|nr:sulfite reductase subunit alpha [Massilia sp. CCM 9206]MDQ1918769.1 sulfite reductase subunit alpha [Massilia sp. CCM 9206]